MNTLLGHVSRKSRKLFGPKKPFVKIPTRLFCKAALFICCKRNKNGNITAKFRASRRLRFGKEICHPKCTLKVSGLSRNGALGPVVQSPIKLNLD